ncbi:MAG: hypothetical protein QM767_16200 [Anaeromyxobacter sp.]
MACSSRSIIRPVTWAAYAVSGPRPRGTMNRTGTWAAPPAPPGTSSNGPAT